MKNLIVDKYLSGKNIFDILRYAMPEVPSTTLYRRFDAKDVKVNGKWVKKNFRPEINDKITIYLKDNESNIKSRFPTIKKVYEDDNLLIVIKPSQLPVESLSDQINEITLQSILKDEYAYLELCHRLDRNTEGLILLAKDPVSLKEVKSLLNNNYIKKYYTVLVHGIVKTHEQTLNDYLFKDSKNSIVYISSEKKKGYMPITTSIKLLEYRDEASLLEVCLLTGRTHQIRAHLSFIGHPVIGDGKYGINQVNKQHDQKTQMLCASRLFFEVPNDSKFNYLNGKIFEINPSFL